MLRTPEITERFKKHFITVDVDFRFSRGYDRAESRPEVKRYNKRQLRPYMVVVNSRGEMVYKHLGGFGSRGEAILFDDFITEKHYRKESFAEYKGARPLP